MIAKASAKLKKEKVRLSREETVDTAWQTPIVIDRSSSVTGSDFVRHR
jgi:hypothetical protein